MLRFFGFLLVLKVAVDGQAGNGNATSSDIDERSAKDGVYIGCFAVACLHFDHYVNISEFITPDTCTATCKENGYQYAAMYNRTECSCSCAQTCLTKSLEDENCGLPCRGSWTKFCGGYGAASQYTVRYPDEYGAGCRTEDEYHSDYPGYRDNQTTVDDVDSKLPLIISVPISATLTAGVILGCFVCRRRARSQSTTSAQNHHVTVAKGKTDSFTADDLLDEEGPRLSPSSPSADAPYNFYENADQCSVATSSTAQRSKGTSSNLDDVTDHRTCSTSDLDEGKNGSGGYVDMNKSRNKTDVKTTKKNSMIDVDGYSVPNAHQPCPNDMSDIPYEFVLITNA